MKYPQVIMITMDDNVTMNLAEDRREKELKNITDQLAVVGSLLNATQAK
jgi:hypothetical protein